MKFSQARLISIARIAPGQDWRLEEEQHPHHEMVVLLRGRIHLRIGEQEWAGGPGDILFYRRGCVHTEWNDRKEPFTMHGIAFALPAMHDPLPVLTADRHGRVRMLCEWISEEFAWPREAPSPLATALFHALLAEWRQLGLHKEPDLVTTTQKFMSQHLIEHTTLEDMADQHGMSRFHFLRSYKLLSGRTPFQDLTRLRLEHARHLLLTTALPLKALAPLCGLANQQHLCRLFRQHFGLTPGEARKQVR